MEEEKKGITLKDIFLKIWSQKWLALAITAIITLVFTVALFYGYNPSKKMYSVKFSLNLPGDNNESVYTYPDGGKFYFTDLVQLDTLEKVKSSNDSFYDIDVSSMSQRGNINIVRERVTNGDGSAVIETSYTISASAGYFSGREQASKFLQAIADYPAIYLLEMNSNYDAYLSIAEAAEDYETEIGYLEEQLNYVIKGYSTLGTTYGESFVVPPADESAGGKTLTEYLLNVRSYKESGVLERLISEARNSTTPYIKSEELKENKYRYDYEMAEREYTKAYNTLQTLLNAQGDAAAGGTVMLDAAVIKQQSDLVQALEEKKNYIQNYRDNGVFSTEFDAKIKAVRAEIKNISDLYSRVFERVYSVSASVKYAGSGILRESGGYDFPFIVLVGLILGIIVACVTAYIVAYLSDKKALKNALTVEIKCAGAEAAVAEETEKEKNEEENKR